MDDLREITRLNLTLELVSECAGLVDLAAVARVVGERMRWLFDFDVCGLALRIDGQDRWLSMRSGDEKLSAAANADDGPLKALSEAAMSSGCPSTSGKPISAVAHPLGTVERPLGSLCIALAGGYASRDLRYLHHVCSGLGAALARIQQSDQLAQANALAARVDRVARDEAHAANQAKDTFLAMLGHELRNPLAPIIAAAELLRRDSSDLVLARAEIIARQAAHLDRLVDDMLDVSRVSTGKVNLRRAALDLRDVAASAAEMVRPRMLSRGQLLSMDMPSIPAMVDGDETRLVQVVSNLLTNASAYSPHGERIRLRVEVGEEQVFLEVLDRGIGIAPDMLDSIFDLFVQGRRSQECAPGGLGLGLGVSRALVELHGGAISASSPGEGCGSVFRVGLPLLLDAMRPSLDVPQPIVPTMARSPRRILLVDDNADAADSMSELLRAHGHEVLAVNGPTEALGAGAAFAPDVAILDIGLPVMDGYQLARELRVRLGAKAPAIIALSGYGQQRDHELSSESGFASHLVKPASLTDLLAAVHAAGNPPAAGGLELLDSGMAG